MYGPLFWIIAIQSFCIGDRSDTSVFGFPQTDQTTIANSVAVGVSVAVAFVVVFACRAATSHLLQRDKQRTQRVLLWQCGMIGALVLSLLIWASGSGQFGVQIHSSQLMMLLGYWTFELCIAMAFAIVAWIMVRFFAHPALGNIACFVNVLLTLSTAFGWCSLLYLDKWCLS